MTQSSAAGEVEPAGAPDDEIEVTPEMIEAGKNVLVYVYEPEWHSPAATAERIYRAMSEARNVR